MRPWLLRLAAIALLVGIPSAVRPDGAVACSCDFRPAVALAESDVVFAGEVTASELRGRAKVRVSRVWKGDVPATTLVVLQGRGTSCEFRLRVGREYLVYADRDDAGGTLTTGLCSSFELGLQDEAARQHLELLGEGRPPAPEKAPDADSPTSPDTTEEPAATSLSSEGDSAPWPPSWAIALVAAAVASVLAGASFVVLRRRARQA